MDVYCAKTFTVSSFYTTYKF